MVDSTPTPTARRGRPGYDRAQVLAAAIELFNKQGYDATSVADLAVALGVTKSALYHHFSSKEDLLGIALDDALTGLETVLSDALAQHSHDIDRLGAIVRGAVAVLIEQLPAVTLLLRVRGNSEVEVAALRRRRAFDQRVSEVVAGAQAAGHVRGDIDPRVLTRLIFGMLNSVVEWYRPDGAVDPDELGEDILRVAVDGVRPREGQGV